jgi:hypothetical protein
MRSGILEFWGHHIQLRPFAFLFGPSFSRRGTMPSAFTRWPVNRLQYLQTRGREAEQSANNMEFFCGRSGGRFFEWIAALAPQTLTLRRNLVPRLCLDRLEASRYALVKESLILGGFPGRCGGGASGYAFPGWSLGTRTAGLMVHDFTCEADLIRICFQSSKI